ncbi:MAG: hypothetical protein ACK47R_12775, partial [Planctomycetia bacterium]
MISWSGWKRATLRKFFVAAILSLQLSLAQNTILAQDAKTGSTSPAKPQARSLAELVDAAKAESPIIRNAQLGLESVVQKQSTLDKMRFLSLISR